MCYQVVERYTSCGYPHRKRPIDPCPQYGQYGHQVDEKTIYVDHVCRKLHDIPVHRIQGKEKDETGNQSDRLESRRNPTELSTSQTHRGNDYQQVQLVKGTQISSPVMPRCYPCQSRGIKCDGRLPVCFHCKRSGRESVCVFDRKGPIKGFTLEQLHDPGRESEALSGLEDGRMDVSARYDSTKSISRDLSPHRSVDDPSQLQKIDGTARYVYSADHHPNDDDSVQSVIPHDSDDEFYWFTGTIATNPSEKSQKNIRPESMLKPTKVEVDNSKYEKEGSDGWVATREEQTVSFEEGLKEPKARVPELRSLASMREVPFVMLKNAAVTLPGQDEELREQQDSAGREEVKTNEGRNIIEIEKRFQEKHEVKKAWQEERERLLDTYLRSRANCFVFPGDLDASSFPSTTRHSLELRLAVLEIWPSHIRADSNFSAKARRTLSSMGLCETPLSPGRCRLRWKCRCGTELFDNYTIPTLSSGTINDIYERHTGTESQEFLRKAIMENLIYQALDGLEEMIGRSRFRGVAVVTRSSTQTTSSIVDVFKGLYYGVLRMMQELSRDHRGRRLDPKLPSHRDPAVQMEPAEPSGSLQTEPIHLLTCLPEQSLGTKLSQKQISNLQFDRDLFALLKATYEEHRGKLRSFFTMRKPIGIHFNEFSLLSTPYVDIHGHEKHCQTSCSCLPPEDKVTNAEYAYNPVPPKRWPPIGPNTLLHLMNSPCCIDEGQVWMLKQFPKKLQGELKASLDEEVIGWGIYFQEGLHWTRIWAAVLTIIILGSFFFGVLWSIFQKDVQGAFGIASWWVSICAVILAWLAARDVGA